MKLREELLNYNRVERLIKPVVGIVSELTEKARKPTRLLNHAVAEFGSVGFQSTKKDQHFRAEPLFYFFRNIDVAVDGMDECRSGRFPPSCKRQKICSLGRREVAYEVVGIDAELQNVCTIKNLGENM